MKAASAGRNYVLIVLFIDVTRFEYSISPAFCITQRYHLPVAGSPVAGIRLKRDLNVYYQRRST